MGPSQSNNAPILIIGIVKVTHTFRWYYWASLIMWQNEIITSSECWCMWFRELDYYYDRQIGILTGPHFPAQKFVCSVVFRSYLSYIIFFYYDLIYYEYSMQMIVYKSRTVSCKTKFIINSSHSNSEYRLPLSII